MISYNIENCGINIKYNLPQETQWKNKATGRTFKNNLLTNQINITSEEKGTYPLSNIALESITFESSKTNPRLISNTDIIFNFKITREEKLSLRLNNDYKKIISEIEKIYDVKFFIGGIKVLYELINIVLFDLIGNSEYYEELTDKIEIAVNEIEENKPIEE